MTQEKSSGCKVNDGGDSRVRLCVHPPGHCTNSGDAETTQPSLGDDSRLEVPRPRWALNARRPTRLHQSINPTCRAVLPFRLTPEWYTAVLRYNSIQPTPGCMLSSSGRFDLHVFSWTQPRTLQPTHASNVALG